ncbi:MAG: bacteriohemerythrin [Candidatus Thiodiazotropha sp. (ex Ctena orbiculata)]|nr:bacteriohemerythrin [Candidatus Thiodiazotropha taylori]
MTDAVSTGARPEIGTTLDNLIDYVVVHFETEERLMEERGYKGLDAHKEEHKQLVQTCADLQKKFHAGEAEIEDGTIVFIKNWLDHHIPVIDKSYSSALSN